MRKLYAALLCAAMLPGIAACGVQPIPEAQTQILTFTEGIKSAWYTEEASEESTGDIDPAVLRVGRTWDGKDIYAFLALPMEDVQSARLWLKVIESNGVPSLRIAAVTGPWSAAATRSHVRSLVGTLTPAKEPREMDGWLSFDVTDYMGCEHGIALFEANHSMETVFAANEVKLEIITTQN